MMRSAVVRALTVAATVAGAAAWAGDGPKVVVIGFDGADARLTEAWMNAGELPNLARLRDEGTYSPLAPTNPPQTPVSWSSFATGLNPGKTEIFDFLKRDPANYLPDFALNSPAKKPFAFGERNGMVAGIAVGAAAFLVLVGISLLVPIPWIWRVAGALALAAAVGWPAGQALARVLPVEVPDAVNHRKGRTFWEIASEAGMQVRVVRVPATFPAEPMANGTMLSGLGVPDMRERVGTPAYYTSDAGFRPGDNEFSLELIPLPARRGKIQTRIIGPRNLPFYEYVVERRTAGVADPRQRRDLARKVREELDADGVERRIDLPMTLEATDSGVTLTVSGQTRSLRVGEWSDWVVLDFPVNWLVDRAKPLRGMTRFKLLAVEPELELYHQPINFHPDCHPIAFSWPPEYASKLAERFGLFKTIGWAIDTWSPSSGVGGDELLVEDATYTVNMYQKIMEGLLGDRDADLYVQIFYFTDRIAHILWRHLDEGHPLYDPEQARRYAPEVLKAYKKMDEIVGRARELAGPDATLIVCSDHGFSSFRRGVNLNTWLIRNGLMTVKGEGEVKTLEDLFLTGEMFENVDWSRTKAYALGLGGIYVNLVGRERNGVVMPGAEYQEVVRQIRAGLEGMVDEATGDRPVTRVWTRDEMYGEGYDPDLIPDLRVGNALNYRVSWQTTLGGGGREIVEDNLKPWSADHCSNDPEVVPGILFSNRKLSEAGPQMTDLMPTILDALGLPVPPGLDGRSLL